MLTCDYFKLLYTESSQSLNTVNHWSSNRKWGGGGGGGGGGSYCIVGIELIFAFSQVDVNHEIENHEIHSMGNELS